jgi:DNA-directed RNA polymerase specialized sigma24 family protein
VAIDAVMSMAAPTARSRTALLVERAQAGDRAAFEALIEDRVWRLLRLAASILLHDADAGDAVQDSCLRAWIELPKLRDRDQFEAWLWRIVINACRSSSAAAAERRSRARHRRGRRQPAVPIRRPGSTRTPRGRPRPAGRSVGSTRIVGRS